MKRVLLVDDEEIYLRATAAMLRMAELDVVPALGGDRALELIGRESFDAALVDVMMPRMSGIELVRRLREKHPELRVVLTSSFPLSTGQIERMGMKNVAFVPKPSPLATLVAALEAAPAPTPAPSRGPSTLPDPPRSAAAPMSTPRRL
jgi:DNA-binding NtrC family response regulator